MHVELCHKNVEGIEFIFGQDQETTLIDWRRKVLEEAPSTTIIAFDQETRVKADAILRFLKSGNEKIVCDLRCEHLDEDLEDIQIHPSKKVLILRPYEYTLYEYPDGSGDFSRDGAFRSPEYVKRCVPHASVVFLLYTNMDTDHVAEEGIRSDHYLKLNETQPHWIGWL